MINKLSLGFRKGLAPINMLTIGGDSEKALSRKFLNHVFDSV